MSNPSMSGADSAHDKSATGADAAPEAVVLLNFGGPRTLDEVRPFLFEILRDPHTLQVPVPGWAQDLLARLIVRRRWREVSRQYGEIGGRSPIVAATDAIAAALEREIAGREMAERQLAGHAGSAVPRSPAPRVYIAHRYLRGHAAQTAARLVADGLQRVLAVPLYPHFSFATTGSSVQQLSHELQRAGFTGTLDALRSYPDAPGYLAAHAQRLREAVAAAGLLGAGAMPADVPAGAALPPEALPPETLPPGTLILCSAHGLPAAYVERGDPYRLELRRSLAGLRRAFPHWEFELSFQSRVGPARWLEPYTDRILAELAARGVKQLLFLPLSFVNDHLETLYEIGHTYVRAAQRLGMAAFRVQAVENHPALVRELAQAVADWRQGLAGVPAGELLPPDQWFRRVGWWLWTAWLAAFSAALAWACTR